MPVKAVHQLSHADKYQILVNRDAAYEGSFIVAVKTTGIFCKPVCTARNPKPENIVFLDTVQQAIDQGYRPCKKCRPLENASELPPAFKNLLEALHHDPQLRIKDADLAQWNITPSLLRRWFKKYYQITFQSYQRMLRMNNAFQKIAEGGSITASAFDAGFGSLSGFNERFKSTFGKAPSQSKATTIISLKQITTPLGPMYAGASKQGICFLEFTDRIRLEAELKALCKELNAVILPGQNEHLLQVEKELNEYFEGKRKTFEVTLHFTGTAFQQTVWKGLAKIPYGSTRSYKQQATALQKLSAIRAVGTANGQNKMAIIVPCHRVVGSNGSMTGYAGGIARKQWLIKFEQENA